MTRPDGEPRDTPALRYYRDCQGQWCAPLSLELTDYRTLSREHSVLIAAALVSMAWWPRILGGFTLHTSVRVVADDRIDHTTAVRWLGLTMLRGCETLTLDGPRQFTLTGHAAATLLPLRYPVEGTGVIDEDGAAAAYHLTWLGAALMQHTRLQGDTLMLTQTGAGYRAALTLRRLAVMR